MRQKRFHIEPVVRNQWGKFYCSVWDRVVGAIVYMTPRPTDDRDSALLFAQEWVAKFTPEQKRFSA